MASQLDRYLEAWVFHCHAGGPDGGDARERLVACTSDDVRYEDVPSGAMFAGHHGIVEMCAQGHHMSADLRFEIVSSVTDGRSYAFESVTSPPSRPPVEGTAFTTVCGCTHRSTT
jgi:hypothetical protein